MNSGSRPIILLLVLLAGCSDGQPEGNGETFSRITGILAEETGHEYRQAYEPRPFIFPDDHGAHPGFRIEWWYFTGNLTTEEGREFGYQFTLFRNAVTPVRPEGASRWATNQIYMAHAALSDIESETFHHEERFSRGALGLAGVEAEPFRAYLEDWTAVGRPCTGEDCFSVEIKTETVDFGIRLILNNTRPPVLHGDRGLSAKSPRPGNASYYYSYPRLQTAGKISLNGQTFRVKGESWFDHEWSTSMLEKDQTGWDWFSLQLSDHTELMIYQIRNRDPDAYVYSGSYIRTGRDPEGLAGDDFMICATGSWRSDPTGIVYPAGWELSLPSKDLVLEIIPKLPAQEMTGSLRYWEGAVRVSGTKSGGVISGHGYAELAGYEERERINHTCSRE